jgi:hypothetical protein
MFSTGEVKYGDDSSTAGVLNPSIANDRSIAATS